MTTTPLDAHGAALLARLRGHSDDPAYTAVPLCTGGDRWNGLRLTLDAARRVVGVEILDVEILRRPGQLEGCLMAAFAAADEQRLLASLRAAGRVGAAPTQDEVARAIAPLSAEPAPRPAPASGAARHGASDNACLHVELDDSGQLLGAHAEAGWLHQATRTTLCHALTEALATATTGRR